MKKYMIKEYFTLPYLLIMVLLENLKGRKKYIKEKVQYGDDPHQYIVYIQPKNNSTNRKVIFFVHGGGWCRGNASLFSFIGYFFAKFGYITIIAGYRLVPKYTYPIQINDVLQSLKTGLESVRHHHIHYKQLIFIGQSAGGQMVSLIAYGQYLSEDIKNI